jgi:hypothetical protein
MLRKTLIGFLIIINAAQFANGQTATISGVVSDIYGHGIASASVIVSAADGLYTATDNFGKYELNVPTGSFKVKYRSPGKEDVIKLINVVDSREMVVNVVLESRDEMARDEQIRDSLVKKRQEDQRVFLIMDSLSQIKQQQIRDSLAKKRQEDQRIYSLADSIAQIKLDSLADIKAIALAEKKIDKLLHSPITVNTSTDEVKKAVTHQTDGFNDELIAMAKAFYKDIKDSSIAIKFRDQINQDILSQIYGPLRDYNENGNVWYAGEEKKGKADGQGIMNTGRTVYDGAFLKGNFYSGVARIVERDQTLYITYSEGKQTGFGYQKLNNGDFNIGQFEDGKLKSGITYTQSSNPNGDSYLGRIKNGEKNGYCEMKSTKSNYVGLYQIDSPTFGYVKEIDQLGFENIYRIIGINKSASSQEAAKPFFDELTNLKR